MNISSNGYNASIIAAVFHLRNIAREALQSSNEFVKLAVDQIVEN